MRSPLLARDPTLHDPALVIGSLPIRSADSVTIPPGSSLRRALEAIQSGGLAIALVAEKGGPLIGILMDSDIRKGLIGGYSVDAIVDPLINLKPITASPAITLAKMMELMEAYNISQVPILDEVGRAVGVTVRWDLVESASYDLPVVVLAGGNNSRDGYTSPAASDPARPVRESSVLENLLRQLVICGFGNIWFAVNSRAYRLKKYFGDGSAFGVRLKYLEETSPLGTAGALRLLPGDLPSPVLVVNGDIITKVHFGHLIAYHRKSGVDGTIPVIPRAATIPYGVVETNAEEIVTISEKPVIHFKIIAGIYVLEKKFASLIPENEMMSMPDLLRAGLRSGWRIQSFPIHEEWFDTGSPTENVRAKRSDY